MQHNECTWGKLGCNAHVILSGKMTQQPEKQVSPAEPEPIGFKIKYCALTPEVSHFGSTGVSKPSLAQDVQSKYVPSSERSIFLQRQTPHRYLLKNIKILLKTYKVKQIYNYFKTLGFSLDLTQLLNGQYLFNIYKVYFPYI